MYQVDHFARVPCDAANVPRTDASGNELGRPIPAAKHAQDGNMTRIGTADLREDQRQALEIVGRQFGRGARNVAVDGGPGFRVLRAVARHLAERVGRGQRCLVLNPMPAMRIHDVRSVLPESAVGALGSGAVVEVASYREAERALVDERPRRAWRPYDLVVIEVCQDWDRQRAKAIRDVFPGAAALLVGDPAPRAVCELDAVVSRKSDGPDWGDGPLLPPPGDGR
jgi:hypothetical protein